MNEDSAPEPRTAPGDPQTPGTTDHSVSTATPPKCPTRTRLYRDGELVAEGFPAEEISERLASAPDAVIWLDLHAPDESDLGIVVQEFGLHPLAVEDALQAEQRPKLDRYRTHLFANTYAVAFDASTAELTTSEISAFITPNALITVRKSEFDVDALQARWDGNPELASAGVGFLVHGLLDAVVDGHYDATEDVDDCLDALEDRVFEPRDSSDLDIRRRAFELRRAVLQLRRIVAPMREVVERILRNAGEHHLANDFMHPYYEDVHDHVLRAADSTENARDRIASILESEQNIQGQQLNEVTKKLAAWAAIIAVPTAVTGYYGQNVPYPGFEHHSGWIVSTAVIVVLSVGLWFLLRRRGWL
ncbi:magnesium transporter CorA family protein [Cryptosporangium arvum]|uniref:Mg2+/Co2+ transporter n=1 Tax=Cryptosporangium arvum DSM 44712 TaxID=927661 RepID=A0A010ZXH0_9ACTN|nr:magnesium transporter CorA family protein [Cryptosporangium arvum]EXG81922.1 Mg2+/Co2+ transporter [Cryptosporangium arvum DSM 44712]